MQDIEKNFSAQGGSASDGKYYFFGLLFLATVLVWCAVFAETRDSLTVAFLDVGQGDAIFIESPDGSQVLIDGGPNNAVLRELSKIMPFYDRSIDMIVETHPDSDHINGLVEVLRRYNVGLIMESGADSDSSAYQEIKKIIQEKNIKDVFAIRGMKINLGEEIYMDILFPDRDVPALETNTASIVAKLVYGNNCFLFTGDSPSAIEQYIVSLGGLECDVLKIAHHGSKTSTSESFLGYVNPEYAVISVGKENKYGHPDQGVLDLLKQFEILIFRTDESGTIKIKSDGENLQIR